ncbi:hypothetical protein FHS14_001171 [Paenibacillus baekrokdamisoli]|nr:hypothetical protein [Paenibacillus baekrokdamisoli]
MPNIPRFPASLLEEHKHWHHSHHHSDPSKLPTGYGTEFLQFHRQYIAKALQWYYQQGYDPKLVAPWTNVPEEIRNTSCYDQGAENRIRFNPRSFASADELGRFLESSNVHGCIHQEAARIYGEGALNDFDFAPQSTMFYNIHGLIDQWYQNWERAMGYRSQGSILGTQVKAFRGSKRSCGSKRMRGKAAVNVDKGSMRRSRKLPVRGSSASRSRLTRASVKRGTSPNSKRKAWGQSPRPLLYKQYAAASRLDPFRRPQL